LQKIKIISNTPPGEPRGALERMNRFKPLAYTNG